MNLTKHISGCLSLLILYACDPCGKCGPLTYEPYVVVAFINADSITKIDKSLSINTAIKTEQTVISSKLEGQISRLETRLDSIRKGLLTLDSLPLKSQLLVWSDSLTHSKAIIRRLDSTRTSLLGVKATINSGKILLESVELENGGFITYEDSMTSFNFPLLYDQNSTSYKVIIAPTAYTLAIKYKLSEEIDAERFVKISASDVAVTQHSFDSLHICKTNCDDSQVKADYIFYF